MAELQPRLMSRREINYMSKRKEKLRSDLFTRFGVNAIDTIDNLINEYGDFMLSKKPYIEVFEELSKWIMEPVGDQIKNCPTSNQNELPEQELLPNPMQNSHSNQMIEANLDAAPKVHYEEKPRIEYSQNPFPNSNPIQNFNMNQDINVNMDSQKSPVYNEIMPPQPQIMGGIHPMRKEEWGAILRREDEKSQEEDKRQEAERAAKKEM